MAINWEGLQSGIGDIGSSLAQYAREQRARQLALEDYKMKQQSELDQAIALAKAKAQAEADIDPFNVLLRGGSFEGSTNSPSISPSSSEVPVARDTINIGGVSVPRDTLMQSYINKKLGTTVFPMDTLKDKKTQLEIAGLEQKQKEAEQASANQSEMILSTAQDNLNTIKAIKAGKRFFGPYANLPTIATPSALGGLNRQAYSDRKTWENNINKLLAQKVVDLIMNMKNASKTGATGFGQLSEREGQLLRDASTALTKDLDPATAEKYLNDMEAIYNKILIGGNSAPTGQGTNNQPSREDIIAELKRRGKL